jgi:hypothetical protein
VTFSPLDKEIGMDMKDRLNQSFQQKPGREMGFFQQKHCQLRPKETGQNEGSLALMLFLKNWQFRSDQVTGQ